MLVALLLCALLLGILFVGGRLWWVSFRGPEMPPPAEGVTGAPEPSASAEPSARAPDTSAPAGQSAGAPETSAPAPPATGMPVTSAAGKPATSAATTSIQLAWDRAPDEKVTGYKILFGTQSGNYSDSMSVGNQTTATLTGLDRGTKYYVVAVAVDAQGNQSRPSNEIEVVVGK